MCTENKYFTVTVLIWGTGIRGLMRGMATLPQGNQPGAISGQRQNWKTPGELGVSKPMECDIFTSVLWHCWLGDRKGIRPVKKLDVGLLVVMVWLELCTIYSSSCHHRFHHPLLQWTPAYPGSPGKWPLKWRERKSNCIDYKNFRQNPSSADISRS